MKGRLWLHPALVASYLLISMVAGAVLIAANHPWTRLTDEDDYIPLGLNDLLQGRNPYAVGRASDHSLDPSCTQHSTGCWYSLPYLPLSLLLQVPFIDYRWTALIAFGALGWGLRDRTWAFLALANPGALLLAANGFTDLVVVALMAWSIRTKKPFFAWLAAGAKQFALPLLIIYHGARREWRKAMNATAFTAAILVPFILWNPGAFYYWTIQVHLAGSDRKWSGFPGVFHGNYLLYYAFAAIVMYPEIKRFWLDRNTTLSSAIRKGPNETAGVK